MVARLFVLLVSLILAGCAVTVLPNGLTPTPVQSSRATHAQQVEPGCKPELRVRTEQDRRGTLVVVNTRIERCITPDPFNTGCHYKGEFIYQWTGERTWAGDRDLVKTDVHQVCPRVEPRRYNYTGGCQIWITVRERNRRGDWEYRQIPNPNCSIPGSKDWSRR